MRACYLLGHPVAHSMSAAMQNAAFRCLGLDAEYRLLDVEQVGLVSAVQGLREPEIIGANVTIPHKVAIVGLMDRLDRFAEAVGAVNTVVNEGGALAGYNTDGPAAVKALREVYGPIGGTKVVLLGAGGAARSVSYALAREGAKLAVLNRDEVKARRIAGMVGAESGSLGELGSRLKGAEILVNATPVGMAPDSGVSPVDASVLHRGLTVFDLVYNPPRTRLLRDAEAVGARALGGVGMLVHQGAEAFRLWTGRDAPVEIMEAAVMGALGVGNH
jgi:shikimate dehydrogenase